MTPSSNSAAAKKKKAPGRVNSKGGKRTDQGSSDSKPGDKMASELAEKIESEIIAKGWPLGESLGSEPALIEQYGVSRAVFREAVRIVEHHGAAFMRRGPHGGLVVTSPDLEAVQHPAMLYLDWADVSAQDLFDVRSAIELQCVRIAIDRLDEDGIRKLRDVLEQEQNTEGEIEVGRAHDLHDVLAELTGNAAMQLFVKTLGNLTYERAGNLTYEPSQLQEVHQAHKAIVEAVIAGDVALAQRRMQVHLATGLAHYHQRAETDGDRATSAGRRRLRH